MTKAKRHRMGNSGVQERKKKWKKVNIEDVEEALEDERITKRLAKKMGDGTEELFTIDTTGDLGKKPKTYGSRKAAAQSKILSWKRERVGTSANEIAKIERADAGTSMRESTKRKLKAETLNENSPFDIWAVDAKAVAPKAKMHLPASSGMLEKRPVKVPKTLGKKISDAPAIVVPHEGQSINPSAENYDDLAFKITADEMEKQFQEQALDRKLKPVTHTLRELADPKDLEGLDEKGKLELFRRLTLGADSHEIQDNDAEQGEEGSITIGKNGVLQKRKTQAERNKDKRRKLREQQQLKEQKEKKLSKSVGAIGSMLKEMKTKSEDSKTKAAFNKEAKARDKELEKKGIIKKMKIGRIYYEEKSADIPESADAGKKGLRAVSLRGQAIEDRISSVFRRGMLQQPPASSKLQMHRIKKHTRAKLVKRKFISPLLKGENNLLI